VEIGMIKSRRVRWARNIARMGEKRNTYRVLVGKRQLGKIRRRWKDNIRMDLRKTRWGGTDWINLIQDRGQWEEALVHTVVNYCVI
jgi:hypothetical protein